MSKLMCLAAVAFASVVTGAELSERFAKRVESADAAYKAAVQKADNARATVVQKAHQDRTRLLKAALSDATKAGDFDAATEIKGRLKPSDLVGTITDVEWLGPAKWGRFVFKSDGTVIAENTKGKIQWVAIDDDSVMTIIRYEQHLYFDRFVFNKERTKVTAYYVGSPGAASWEVGRGPAKK